MAFRFRRRERAERPDDSDAPQGGDRSDSQTTIFVTGDRRVDTDRIRSLVDGLREMSSEADPERLLVTMVDGAVRTVGAERGMLFRLNQQGGAELRVGRSDRGEDLPAAVAWSSKVVQQVLETGEPVCIQVGGEGDFDPSQSMINLNLRAVMCVALVAGEKRLGAIYVDTRAGSRSFQHTELRFFEAFADMLSIVWSMREAERERLKERLAAESMRQDLELARAIQSNLVPEHPLVEAGYAMCGRVVPAAETGGDYFDFFKTRRGVLVMAVGDVSGHGSGAALVMSAARAYLRAFCQHETSPAAVLRRINRQLVRDIADDMFMSMFLCMLDLDSGRFRYGNAGHTCPVLLRGSSGATENYRVTGMALGVEPETDYDERGPFEMATGDTVVMFSDGLTELRQGEDLYGRARTVASIRKHAAGTAQELLDGMFADAFAWGAAQGSRADDVTVAVIRAVR